MTNITELAEELRDLTQWQRTPEPLFDEDYVKMIKSGIKTLYIDTGRASTYNKEWMTEETADDKTTHFFAQDLKIDEEKYVLIVAQIAFFKRVQQDVNNIVSYTTDALSVSNADKPYAHLADTITGLENERRIVFYKMVDYSFYRG